MFGLRTTNDTRKAEWFSDCPSVTPSTLIAYPTHLPSPVQQCTISLAAHVPGDCSCCCSMFDMLTVSNRDCDEKSNKREEQTECKNHSKYNHISQNCSTWISAALELCSCHSDDWGGETRPLPWRYLFYIFTCFMWTESLQPPLFRRLGILYDLWRLPRGWVHAWHIIIGFEISRYTYIQSYITEGSKISTHTF